MAGAMAFKIEDYSDNIEDLSEQDFDDIPDEPGVSAWHEPESSKHTQNQEEKDLLQKDIYERCSHILEQLKGGKRRWSTDQDGEQHVDLLESYKRRMLVETDKRDPQHPTLLHALARKWKQYDPVHPLVKKSIIYMIRKAPKNGEKETPIWSEALSHTNLAFISFIKQNCPEELPEILAMQDDMDQNFFHNLFCLAIRICTQPQRQETLIRAREYLPYATDNILATQDKVDKNTPIHYALHPHQCQGRGPEYVNLVKKMVKKADKPMGWGSEFNKHGQSPYQYCRVNSAPRKKKIIPKGPVEVPTDLTHEGKRFKSNVTDESKGRATTVAANTKAPLGSVKNPGAPPLPGTSSPNASMPRTSMPPPERGRPRAIHEGNRQGSRPQSVDHGHPSLNVRPGLQRTPTNPSLGESQPSSVNPSDELRQAVAEPKSQSSQSDREKSMKHLLVYLKLHYLRERSDVVARELIYGKHACERNLYFNAISLKDKEPSQIVKLIGRLSVGGIDENLSCVRIPTTKMIAPAQQALKKESKKYVQQTGSTKQEITLKENPNPGRQSLVPVFDKLHEAGVRMILNLNVDDMDLPYHTDAAIERAIAGRDSFGKEIRGPIMVETWDWQKPDLSIDVIYQAAPKVQHLVLYWSGNQAILRGWASEEGIPRLCCPANKSELKTVTIYAAPGLESTDRMMRYFDTFNSSIQQRIKESARPNIKLNLRVTGFTGSPSSTVGNSSSLGGEGSQEIPQSDKWMKAMDRFRHALQLVHNSLPENHRQPEKVKVALIDDGVRLDKLNTYFQDVEASGLSYYSGSEHTEEPWHHSTHGHGTVMANMITRINPWVSLCVLRVYEVLSKDGNRMITPHSAALAIRAAIGRKVNIISMSWTLLAKKRESGFVGPSSKDLAESERDPDLEDLRAAIGEAVKAKILIFCSANDDISLKAKDFLPYQKASNYIFRIGAADPHGKPDNVSEDYDAMNFYLPGNNVAETENPTAVTPIKYHTGASVSTALAAGLASLIIYCGTLGQVYYDSIGDKQRAEEFARKRNGLKERNNLETAFQSIKFEGWDRPKYLPVWGEFGDAAASIGNEGGKPKLEALTTLVHKLSSSIR